MTKSSVEATGAQRKKNAVCQWCDSPFKSKRKLKAHISDAHRDKLTSNNADANDANNPNTPSPDTRPSSPVFVTEYERFLHIANTADPERANRTAGRLERLEEMSLRLSWAPWHAEYLRVIDQRRRDGDKQQATVDRLNRERKLREDCEKKPTVKKPTVKKPTVKKPTEKKPSPP